MRKRRRRETPKDVAISIVKEKTDRDGFFVKEISPKGRGVFANVNFMKDEFLLQYAGKLIPADEGDRLEEECSSGFRFFITFKGKEYCIDATEEPEVGPRLGRLVNHGEKNEVNVKASLIDVDGQPALCLFALTDISEGQELLYDYGVSNLPWKQQNQEQQDKTSLSPGGREAIPSQEEDTSTNKCTPNPSEIPTVDHLDSVEGDVSSTDTQGKSASLQHEASVEKDTRLDSCSVNPSTEDHCDSDHSSCVSEVVTVRKQPGAVSVIPQKEASAERGKERFAHKMRRRKRETPKDVAISMVKGKTDRDGFFVKEISPKGRGVFADVNFLKDEFLLQYAGKLISADKGDRLEEECSSGFRFFFTFKGKEYCIDATEEPEVGPLLGRLVNHGEKNEVNVKASLIDVDGQPALCLFALTDILEGQELLYDYGVSNLPWKQQNKEQQDKTSLSPEGREAIPSQEEDTSANKCTPNPSEIPTGDHLDSVESDVSSTDTPGKSASLQHEASVEKDTRLDSCSVNPSTEDHCESDHSSCVSEVVTVRKQLRTSLNPQKDTSDAEPVACFSVTFNEEPPFSDVSSSTPLSGTLPEQNAKGSHLIENDTLGEECFPLDLSTNHISSRVIKYKALSKQNRMEVEKGQNGERSKPDEFVMDFEGYWDSDSSCSDSQSMTGDDEVICESDFTENEEVSTSDPKPVNAREYNRKEALRYSKEINNRCKSGGSEGHIFVMNSEEDCDSDASGSDSQSMTADDVEYVPESDYSDSEGESTIIPLPRRTDYGKCASSSSCKASTSSNTTTNVCGVANDEVVSSSSDIHNQLDDLSGSRSQSSRIRVLQTNNGAKRKYDKISYCPFCKTKQAKLPRHLAEFKDHQNEKEVLQWKTTTDPELKAKRLTKMRNYGNFLHNTKVRKENQGVLIPVYRPNFEADPDDYLPCSDCFGYYAKKDLWKHQCTLREPAPGKGKEGSKRRNYIQEGKMMLPETGLTNITSEIFRGLRSDNKGISFFIKTDVLIIQLAEKLALKIGHDKDQYPYIRTKLREVGRMVVEYRNATGETSASLSDLIDPKKFINVVNATRQASGFNDEQHFYKTPSLALKIGHSLKKAAEILKGDALMKGDFALEQRSRSFIELYNMKWEELVSAHALRTLKEMKRNNPKYLPVTTDIVKLTQYLREKVESGVETLKNDQSSEYAWKNLAEVTLASLIVFNRKRSGEVAKMTTSDLAKCTKGGHGVASEGLSKLEQELCKILWRVEIIGKKGRTVPILITNKIKDAIDLLHESRSQAGVLEENDYVFAMLHSNNHMRGADSIRVHARNCGGTHPEYVTSTGLRKHVATVCQVMNLRDNELDVIAKFMGHDIRTHREYYRLPDQTLQLAKVSKVLLNIENGNIQSMAGKSLDDIEISPDEEVPMDESIMDDSEKPSSSSSDAEDGDLSEDISEDFDVEPDSVAESPCIMDKSKANADTKKRRIVKQPWTADEKEVIAKRFAHCFQKNTLPGKKEIESAINAEPILKARTWTKVKDFIRNQLRKEDPMGFL